MIARPLAAAAAAALAVGLIGATAPDASAASVSAAAKKYPNCAALNKVHPAGVGVPGARDKVSGGGKPVTNYTRDTAVYKANRAELDRDKDGIACEKRVSSGGTPAPKPAPKPAPGPRPVKPVSKDFVQFSDPTGSILCALDADPAARNAPKVTCVQLRLMSQARYKKLCTKQAWEGLTTRSAGTGWSCSNNPSATPWVGQPGLSWAGRSTPVITGKYGFAKGRRLVVLSPKRSLKLGTITCAQSGGSTTCTNSATRQGFSVTPAGDITWRGVNRVKKFGES